MSIFRNNLPDGIKNGLNQRKSAMVNRTPQTIQYMNSRNAWIRMTSAVDVNGNNDYASSYVLQGGTLNSGGSGLKSGIGNSSTNAYSTVSPRGVNNRLGIRPMPGITSMDVTTKAAYGSLRDITVSFQCWDIRQLEDLELIYMRPGFTVLVEWGWAPYIDATGKYNPVFTDFYSNNILNPATRDRNTILNDLYKKSVSTGGNYDAMYGYIKNFEWVSRNDGGYDCKTMIKSTGEIIESLKVNYVRADLYDYKMYVSGSSGNGFLSEYDIFPKKSNQPSALFAAYYQKNTLAGMWAELNLTLKDPGLGKVEERAKSPILKDKYMVIDYPGLKNYGDANQFIQNGSGIKTYITLEAAFDLINEFILTQAAADQKPLIKLSTKTETYSSKDAENLLCVAHPLQVSLDPTACLIKNSLWYTDIAPAITATTEPIATTATNVASNAIINTIKEIESSFFSFDSYEENRSKFLSAIKTIADGIQYAAINDDLISGKTNPKYKFSDGLVGLINKFFSEQDGNDSKRIGNDDFIYEDPLPNLYMGYQIQQHFKSINVGFEINITKKDNTSTTLTAILANRVPAPYFIDIKELAESESSGGVKYYKPVFSNMSAATITTSATTATAAAFVLNAGDAVATIKSLEFLNKEFFYEKPSKELGTIGNIYVSLDLLYRHSLNSNTESSDSKEKNEIDLKKYIKSIISDVQVALGNINNFEIHVDPVDNVARVIDINYTSPIKPSNLFTLEINKTNSIVRSYSLQSQIFPSQTTLIAVGAQSKGGKLGLQTNTLTDFNRGLTDRVLTTKTDPGDSISKSGVDSPTLAASIASIVILFAALNKEAPTDGSANTVVNISELISKSKNAMRDIITYFQQIQTDSPGKNRSLLPFKFSFEMDGMGGIPIGSLFRINEEALPKGYRGTAAGVDLAQTVTKVSHTLSGNDWKTKIESTSVVLDRPLEGTFNKIDIKQIIKDAVDALISQGVGNPPYNKQPAVLNAGGGGGGTFIPGVQGNTDAMKIAGDTVFSTHGEKPSVCAGYTYNIAYNYTEVLKGKSPVKSWLSSGGDANEQDYRDALVKLGYKMTSLGVLTRAQLDDYINKIKEVGTIINYRSTEPVSNIRGDNFAYIFGHTQIYTGAVLATSDKIVWASSYGNNYNGPMVYPSKKALSTGKKVDSWETYVFTL